MTTLHPKHSALQDGRHVEGLSQDFQETFADIKLLAETDMDEATRKLFAILDDYPDSIDIHQLAGEFYEERKLYRHAYECFKKVVELDTDNGDAWYQFGSTLFQLAHYDAALIASKRAVGLCPENSNFYVQLGQVYDKLEAIDDAHTAYDIALKINPDDLDCLYKKAILFVSCGKIDEAKALYERILTAQPGLIHPLYQLIKIKAFEGSEQDVIHDLKTQINTQELNTEERCLAHFGIANLYERLEDYDNAFAHYSLGNQEKSTNSKQIEIYEQLVNDSIEGYSEKTFQLLKNAAHSSNKPIFIVGMMRSGTTLVEQVLSRHSKIFSAGEVLKLPQIADTLINIKSGAFQYPRDISLLSPEVLSSFANDYLVFLESMCQENVIHITDKLPFNFFHIGLIKVLFPNAKIIHCKRNPLDTCLSCYVQNFVNDFPILNSNLEGLGRFYHLYQKLMKHWGEVIPGEILDIEYENFTEEPEQQTERLLSYLGLDWEDSCLEHHKSSRSVKTASQWQVQQPIYSSSVGRWKKYEKHLQPLIDVLGPV